MNRLRNEYPAWAASLGLHCALVVLLAVLVSVGATESPEVVFDTRMAEVEAPDFTQILTSVESGIGAGEAGGARAGGEGAGAGRGPGAGPGRDAAGVG